MPFRNLSLRQISAINAGAISIVVAIAGLVVFKTFIAATICFGVCFITAYMLFHFFLEQFIDNRIKLIYKFIYQTKASKREEIYYKYILPKKSLDQVSEDVENWATEKRDEIEQLKQNEIYRKEFLQNLSHEFKNTHFCYTGLCGHPAGWSYGEPGSSH